MLLVVNSLLVIACLGTAGVFTLIRQKASELPVVDIGAEVRAQTTDDGPRNILLVGTDSSASLDKNDPITKGRNKSEHLADVIMILRVDPASNTASLLSIPRDTWVPIAPTWSKTKINSAFGGNDGSNLLIATIKHNFGISIDNYAEVDFGGFRGLVEVLGGIPVFNEHPVRDPATGLFLPETGCIVIDPAQALAYARSRHFEYQEASTYDKSARWKTDPTGDLGRISRQQDFLRQAATKAISQGIRNPATALGLVNAALDSVTVDDQLSGGEIADLIGRFRNFSVDSLQTEQLPTKNSGNSGVSYQEILWADAEGLLDVFRGIRADGEVVPADVIIGLPSPSDSSATLVEQLDGAGFDAGFDDGSVKPATAAKKGASAGATVIRFGLRGVEAARVLAAQLGGPVQFEFKSDLPGRRLELAPGATVPEVLATAAPIDSVPMPTFPETTTRRSTTTTTTSTTSTTIKTGKPGATTTTGVDSPSTTASPPTASTLLQDVTTTTAIGVVPLNADSAADCS